MRLLSIRPRALAAALLALCSAQAAATEFAVTPLLRLGGEFNTNRLLRPQDTPDVVGARADVALAFEGNSPRTRVRVQPRARRAQYDEDIGLNRTDVFVDLNADHAWNAFWRGGVDFNFTRDSTVTSDTEDQGLVFSPRSRIQRTLNARLTHDWSDRNRFDFSASYSDVVYGEGVALFSDYTYKSVNGIWTHVLGPRDSVSLSLFHSWFNSFQTENRSRNVGLQLGWRRAWSEKLSSALSVGSIWSELSFVNRFVGLAFTPDGRLVFVEVREPGRASDQGLLLDFSVDRQWERGAAGLAFSHTVTPTGRGAQSTTDEVDLSLTRRLSERMRARLAVGYLREDFGSSGEQAFNRERVRGELSLIWRLSQFWSVRSAYSYVHEQRSSALGSASANRLMLTFIYSGDRRSVSH